MSKTLVKILIVQLTVMALCITVGSHVFAQSAKRIEQQADASFAKKDYYNAAQLYAGLLNENPIPTNAISMVYPVQSYTKTRQHKIDENGINRIRYKLAESYRLYEQFQEAAPQYLQYINSKDPQYPLANLWYGYCLLANNDPQKAISIFNGFIKKYHKKDEFLEKAEQGIATANLVLESKNLKPAATISKLQNTGSEMGSNFALEKLNQSEFWFSSSRPELNKHQEQIFPIRLYKGDFKKSSVTKVFDQIASQINMAANSFSADGNTVYLTAWKEESTSGNQPFAIYCMKRKDEQSKWSDPVKLPDPVNIKGYQSKQPFITADGKWLFYASNQPGGFGKYDIWMIAMDGDKPIGKPFNLGASINTSGNEVTPFFNTQDSILHFSSDGRIGMGGYDIYATKGAIEQNNWSQTVTHLGAPYNSVKDDEYFKPYGKDTAYLSSDRYSSCCLEILRAIKIRVVDTAKIVSIKRNLIEPDSVMKYIDTSAVIRQDQMVKTKPVEEKIVNSETDSLDAITYLRRNVYYNFASSSIREEDYKQLDEIVNVLEKNADLNILIASFTDCKGSMEANIRLSRKRSEAVRWYLIRKGINTSRINIDFFGKEHFILKCKEDTSYHSANQLSNRRSDLIITKGVKPRWVPSGRELDISKINPDSNYHSQAFYAVAKKLNLQIESTYEINKTIKDEQLSVQKIDKPLDKNKITVAEVLDKNKLSNNNPIKIENQKTQTIAKNDTALSTQNFKPNLMSEYNKIQMETLLDTKPRLKESEIINEMTKRISKKPILVFSTSDFVRIDLYDNGVFDYDTVSVIFNKQIMAYKELLQVNKPVSFFIKLDTDQRKNEMIFFAENLGLTPPNSALMVITDADNKRTEVSVSSDLNTNVVIYFIKLNKEPKK